MSATSSNRPRVRRFAAAVLAIAGACAIAQLASVTVASAAPTRVVQAFSATDSVAKKSATAACPSGTRVYSGGGDIVGGGHEVALTGLRPVSTVVSGQFRDSFVVTAEEDDTGYAANWTVYAYAMCGPTLANMSIQQGQQFSTGSDRVNAAISCPSGTAPIGLGAEIGNGAGNVALNAVLGNYTQGPYGGYSGWAKAAAFVDESGYAGSWSLTSYAVCAAPPAGLSYQFADSMYDATDDKTGSVQCPVGTKVYGVGGYLSYLNGQTHFDRMVAHGAQWDGADAEGRTDQTGFANPWWVEVEAICAQ
jgi:hypothetical protein